MKPNGRRAWRKWCKRARLHMNKHHRALYRGAIMRKKQPERTSLPTKPLTARSLVGISQSARKHTIRALFVELVFTSQGTAIEPTDKGSRWFHLWCRGSGDAASRDPEYAALRAKYRIGERLRPCPGCMECDPSGFASICDGSGVLPAGRQR